MDADEYTDVFGVNENVNDTCWREFARRETMNKASLYICRDERQTHNPFRETDEEDEEDEEGEEGEEDGF